jgi:hypothetical protein
MRSFSQLLGDRHLSPRSRTILFVLVMLGAALLNPLDPAYSGGGVRDRGAYFASRPSLLAAFASASSPPRASSERSTSEGLQLLHKMQDALGGAKRIAAIRDYDETIRAEAFDASGATLGEVRKRTRWMRSPSTIRLDQIGPRGTYVLYLDGASASGWEILPDLESPDRFKTTGKPVALTGGELEFAKAYLTGFELDLWLADTHGYTVTSPRPNTLRIEHHGNATDYTLDPSTRLPVKDAGVSLADPDHPVPSEMTYGGWKEIAGVRFATHRVKYMSGVKRGEVTTGDIRVNVGLRPEELAAKPADFAPDIPRRQR